MSYEVGGVGGGGGASMSYEVGGHLCPMNTFLHFLYFFFFFFF